MNICNGLTAWLDSADPDLKEFARDLLDAAGSRFHDSNYEEDALEIGELLDVVSWYHTLIPPKLARAVSGLLEHNDPEPGSSDIVLESRRSDANGSGKIALVAVERSISAWLRLHKILPAQEDAILELLSLLGRIQNGIHAVLPGVKTFFRPGFDGEPSDDEG